MLPSQLNAESFASYPPQARSLAIKNLSLIQQLPLVFAALLLREMGGYDWRFPAERRVLDDQFAFLQSLSPAERDRLLDGMASLSLSLSSSLASQNWVGNPQTFIDALTSQLWSTHQIDAFRQTAEQYSDAWRKAKPEPIPAVPRFSIAVLGEGVRASGYPLFRKLRAHGVFVPEVDPANAWPAILDAVSARAAKHPFAYGHWYIDGGAPDPHADSHLTSMSYSNLGSVRTAILQRMRNAIGGGNGGPEALRTMMAEITPKDLGFPASERDDILSRFKLSVLTEGSGTQVFSTTFVQWTAREVLRRAQPCTLLLRFAPRQRQLPMNDMLSGVGDHTETDPEGSLMDADMGAFYTWINQQRLAGAGESSFLAWSEEHNQAVAISPTLPKATTAGNSMTMKQILSQLF